MKVKTVSGRLLSALAVIAAGFAMFAVFAPAQAAPTDTKGKATTNIAVREGPSLYVAKSGGIAKGQAFNIRCKVAGTSVQGNYRWYALADRRGWVSAKYVDNVGAVPKVCPAVDGATGGMKAKAPLVKRYGPTRSDGKRGSIASGAEFDVRCYALGESIDGNNRWYYLNSGSWVAARYMQRAPQTPNRYIACRDL